MAKLACDAGNVRHYCRQHLVWQFKRVDTIDWMRSIVVDRIFVQFNLSSRGHKCKAMEGLIEEGKEILEEEMEVDVRDAAQISAAAQRVEHYEIAAYGGARTFAEILGHGRIAQLLQDSLDEERAADEKLTLIAMECVNAEAVTAE